MKQPFMKATASSVKVTASVRSSEAKAVGGGTIPPLCNGHKLYNKTASTANYVPDIPPVH